jgi:hypothetical protein
MPDIEKNEIDEVTASAMGLAAYHFQNAILTTLFMKKYLTVNEAALVVTGAVKSLEALKPTPDGREMVALAKLALTNLEKGWKSQARGH